MTAEMRPGRVLTVKLTLAGAAFGLVMGWLATGIAGAGHGTMWPAMVLFPFAWAPIAALGPGDGTAETIALCVGLLQYAVYGGVLGEAHRRGRMGLALLILLLAHAVALLIPFAALD